MEMLILAAVAAFWVKNVALDFTALATGRTPPSHAYRMAKLREKAAKERRRQLADPDMRGGLRMVLRHCWLDACEDLDAWRAHRHATRGARRAARRARRAQRRHFTARWGWRPGDAVPQDVVDAEVFDDPPPAARPAPPGGGGPRSTRSTTTTTTTTTVTEKEGPGADVVLLVPEERADKPPLPHRRMVLMTMLSSAGYAPDIAAIAQMGEAEVDAAIAALIAQERATRGAAHPH